MVMQDSQSRPGKTWGVYPQPSSFSVTLVASAETVVTDEIWVLVQQGDDLRCAVRGHVGSGRVEPDNDWKLRILGQEFFDLWNGLGVEIAVEITVLGRIPVVACGIMIAGLVGGPARRGQIRSEEHTSELQSLRHLVC